MSILTGITQIETGLKMIWSLAKSKYIEAIERTKTNNPLLRIFFDSDLGSSVEKAIEQAYSMSLYEDIKSKLPNWKIADKAAKSLGNVLGRLSAKVLDAAKLNYKYCKKQINLIQYRYEATKRTLCTAATIIDKGWDFIGVAVKTGTTSVLISLGVSSETAEYIADKTNIFFGVFKDDIINFIKSEKVVEFVAEGVQKVAAGVKKIVDIVKEKIPPVIEKIANAIETTTNKVVDFAKATTNTIKEGATKAGNWIMEKWNKIKPKW